MSGEQLAREQTLISMLFLAAFGGAPEVGIYEVFKILETE